jgi:hypothetical protein
VSLRVSRRGVDWQGKRVVIVGMGLLPSNYQEHLRAATRAVLVAVMPPTVES